MRKVLGVQYNGTNFDYLYVGQTVPQGRVVRIEEVAPNPGEEWYEVHYENGNMLRINHADSVNYGPEESSEVNP